MHLVRPLVSKVQLRVCLLSSSPTPVLAGSRMQPVLWLVTSTLAAVLGMAQLEESVCRAPDGQDGFPGVPGLDGRPGQKGDVGEPGKGEAGMCSVGGLGASSSWQEHHGLWEQLGRCQTYMNFSFSPSLPREINTEDGHPGIQRG